VPCHDIPFIFLFFSSLPPYSLRSMASYSWVIFHVESSVAAVKINKYDVNAVKQTLDDAVVSVVAEGHIEDTSISNVKLMIGAACIVLAVTSQFWPIPFPQNKMVLQLCLSIYLLLTVLSQVYLYIKEKDAIFVSQNTHPYRAGYSPVVASSSMGRLSPLYSVTLTHKHDTQRVHRLESPVSEWFHEDGLFNRDRFVQQMRNLLDEFESSKKQ
jgi:hypothetical protein